MTNKIFTALTGLLLAWASVACKTTEDQNTTPKGGGNTIAEAAAARPQSFKSDDDMLDYIQKIHLNYMWEGAEPTSGLARERVHLDNNYPQNDADVTYCSLLSKQDGLLDPADLTAVQAEARVRAFLGFPRTRLPLGDQTLIITRAHVSKTAETPLSVQFSDGNYLAPDELIAPSGKTMTAEAFLRGHSF